MSWAGDGHGNRLDIRIPLACEGKDDALKVYLADEVVSRVGNVDLAQVVHGDVFGLGEVGVYGPPQVTSGARNASAGDGGYYSVECIDLSDPVIERVSDVDVAAAVYVHTLRGMEGCVERGTFVTLEARAAGTRGGGDDSGSEVDFSNAVVAGVCNIEVVIVVDGESEGRVEGGGRCGASVSREARIAGSGNGRDYFSFDIDLANSVSRAVGDVNVAAAVDGDAGR